jgi:hypothetical protein
MKTLSVAFVFALGLCVFAQADQLPIIGVVCTGSWSGPVPGSHDPTGGGFYGCAGAIDGITTDFPNGQGAVPAGFWLGGEQVPNETLTFDLGSVSTISSVDLYNTHNAVSNDRGTLAFQIWISTTPVTPDTTSSSFGTLVVSDTLAFYPSTDPNPAQSFSFPPTIGRYVTFRALSYPSPSYPHYDGGAGLSEIVLHGAAQHARPNGTLVSWGSDGALQVSGTPTGGSYQAVAGAFNHTLALTTNGMVAGWGDNSFAETDGKPTTGSYTAIAAAYFTSLALRSDGAILLWGYDCCGQVVPFTGAIYATAVAADFPAGPYTAIAAGDFHSLALKSDGTIVGRGFSSQIDVPTSGTYIAIAAGSQHSLALRSDGTIVGWGDNTYGQINVPTSGTYIAIAAGNRHSLPLRSDGAVVGWGDNTHGQINVPTSGAYTAISADYLSSIALKSDGTIVGWGYDCCGQVSGIPTTGIYSAIAANGFGGVAILHAPNTPVGSPIVAPADATTGTTPATVTFSTVTQAGSTTLATSGTGAAPPSGFSVGSPAVYYDLTTTAVFSGSISVCINYTGITFTGPPELFHFQGVLGST